MADPFALINRSMTRNAAAKGGYPGGGGGYGAGRRRKVMDPTKPKDLEYLRRMHPDFDEVMVSANIDYRTICHTDANFANKFRIPPVQEPQQSFREHTNSVDAVCWGPDPGTFISASHDCTLKVWDARRGVCTETLSGHPTGIYHCAVASNRTLVLSCASGEEKNALVWKWPEKKVCAALKGHRRSVVHGNFSPDGACAATVDQDGLLIVHDLARGAPVLRHAAHVGSAHGATFCGEDGNLVITVGADGAIHLVDIREHSTPKAWHLPSTAANIVLIKAGLSIPKAHDGYAVHAAEFPTPTAVYTAGADHKLKRWDLRSMSPFTAKCAGQYLGHTAPVRSLAVSPDQRFVVSGCEDGSLRVWPRDPLGDLRSSLREKRAEIKQLETLAQDDNHETTQEEKRRLEELKHSTTSLKEEEGRLARDGYVSAHRTLNAHVGLVSAVSWQEDANKRVAHVLSSSWDQSVQLCEVKFSDLCSDN